jgi:hypothetical protein
VARRGLQLTKAAKMEKNKRIGTLSFQARQQNIRLFSMADVFVKDRHGRCVVLFLLSLSCFVC